MWIAFAIDAEIVRWSFGGGFVEKKVWNFDGGVSLLSGPAGQDT